MSVPAWRPVPGEPSVGLQPRHHHGQPGASRPEPFPGGGPVESPLAVQLGHVLHDGVYRFVDVVGECLGVGGGESGLIVEVGEMGDLVADRPGLGRCDGLPLGGCQRFDQAHEDGGFLLHVGGQLLHPGHVISPSTTAIVAWKRPTCVSSQCTLASVTTRARPALTTSPRQ